ncbi:MAG: prevent-host-death protein [bacterium]|nr:prevent-host-death protein [bacterium]
MADEAVPVGVRALRENLSDYLRRVRQGASFVVMSRGEAVAELRAPAASVMAPRRAGLLKGRIAMGEDFDDLPAEVLDAMEGREA